MPTTYTYRGSQRPIVAGKAWPNGSKTNPAQGVLVYTDPATVKTLLTDDDNSNNLADYYPEARHGVLQVVGGTIRYTYSGQNPTATIGTLVVDGGSVEFENQPVLLRSVKFIKASGTPVVQLEPLA